MVGYSESKLHYTIQLETFRSLEGAFILIESLEVDLVRFWLENLTKAEGV